MIRVKLSTDSPGWPLQRQTPGGTAQWGDCQFTLNGGSGSDYDYWVVFSDLSVEREEARCPLENTILVTGEPPGVRSYSTRFLRQFGKVITCQRDDLEHPNLVFAQQGYPWHVGRRVDSGKPDSFHLDYDHLKAMTPPNKTELISVICSDKAFTSGHQRRLEFVRRLREHFGERLHVFGRGVRDVTDKWDAIAHYKYHVVIENSSVGHYWTEKLADAYLGWSYPFYQGCPNIMDYFPPGSISPIDSDRPAEAIATIEAAIATDQYLAAGPQVAAARQLVLDRYNLFAMLAAMCVEPRKSQYSVRSVRICRSDQFGQRLARVRRAAKRLLTLATAAPKRA